MEFKIEKEDFSHIFYGSGFEFKKFLKNKRFMVLAIIATILPLIYYVLPKVMSKDLVEDPLALIELNLGSVNLLVIISAAVFMGSAVSGEIQNKTALLLFPTPQKRTSILLGKFLAAVLATWVITLLYYTITTVEAGAVYGFRNIPLEVLESLGISLLYGISVISFMFLLTGFMKRSITAIITGILSYFMVLPLVSSVLQGIDVEPWFVVTYSAGLITDVLGATGDAGFGPGKHMAVPGFEPDLGLGILVMAIYSLVLFTHAMTVSLKRTME
jgi:ABC-type transport system involved in multi-copper enzyme maturation permease subunit